MLILRLVCKGSDIYQTFASIVDTRLRFTKGRGRGRPSSVDSQQSSSLLYEGFPEKKGGNDNKINK
jgi:hypothetical protein